MWLYLEWPACLVLVCSCSYIATKINYTYLNNLLSIDYAHACSKCKQSVSDIWRFHPMILYHLSISQHSSFQQLTEFWKNSVKTRCQLCDSVQYYKDAIKMRHCVMPKGRKQQYKIHGAYRKLQSTRTRTTISYYLISHWWHSIQCRRTYHISWIFLECWCWCRKY